MQRMWTQMRGLVVLVCGGSCARVRAYCVHALVFVCVRTVRVCLYGCACTRPRSCEFNRR